MFRFILICVLVLTSAVISTTPSVWAAGVPPGVVQQVVQHGQSGNTQTPLWPHEGASYYSFRTAAGVTVHVISVDMTTGKWRLVPVFNDSLATTSATAQRVHGSAAVNGGYFDLTTGDSVSYVVINGQAARNRTGRHAGKSSGRDKLARYRSQINNRTEIRILDGSDGKQFVQIVPHNSPLPSGCKLVHSLQGGPLLLPAVATREEAFVRRDGRGKLIDVISSTSRAARTAIGVTTDGRVLLVAVDGPEQGSGLPGLTLSGMSGLMKQLGCVRAMNLDGGHSTTMVVKTESMSSRADGKVPAMRTVCGAKPQRSVKTVLVLMPADAH